jgi:SOS response associated peptidase (SRAP)
MSLEHKMPKLNPALFEPLKRIGKSSAVRAGLRARINKVISSFLRRATNRSGGKVKAPSFRQAFIKRRCRISADGFYEWRKEPKLRRISTPKSEHVRRRWIPTTSLVTPKGKFPKSRMKLGSPNFSPAYPAFRLVIVFCCSA